jgi:hypothetical protein
MGVKLGLFEYRVVGKTFEPKRDEVTGEWRKLHNEVNYNLNSTPNIIWVIKSRRIRWMAYVARMGKRRGAYRALVGRPQGKNYLEYLGVDGRIILKRIFKKWDVGMIWIDLDQDRDKWQALVNAVMNLRVP